ncbi:DUF3180 domain-containing protein [Rhodococcus sp. 14-2470-1b]|jgi:hypothetical protein|nr:DUF3180 domain-containing protein [Rhodococcus sp. 15-1189-1-1a]OZF13570.1 DUF3180 domain-containing protein [Rhodococcus sp. 14-2686-1-2]OZF51621.1 DUF3180 domain-containing protein [Rhodococcus sp. 14-2470-1b]
MTEMKPTRVRDLVSIALFAAVAMWLLVRSFYGMLPPMSVLVGASLYPIAIGELIFAFVLRSRVGTSRIGDGPRHVHPITAARALALAKASALVGAAVTGIWAGFLVHILPQASTVRAAAADRPGAIVGLLAGLALVGAALWLEQCCRTPEDRGDDPR